MSALSHAGCWLRPLEFWRLCPAVVMVRLKGRPIRRILSFKESNGDRPRRPPPPLRELTRRLPRRRPDPKSIAFGLWYPGTHDRHHPYKIAAMIADLRDHRVKMSPGLGFRI